MSVTQQGLLCVAAGTIMHLFLGCFFLWGNISVYVTSYFHMHNGDVTLDTTSVIVPVQLVAMTMFTPVAPFALKVAPPWLLCLIGSIISIASCIIASFMTNFILFAIFYGFFFGLGTGMAYMAPIITSWDYFPEKKGIVSGIILAGYGFGPFIFGYLSSFLANPDNETPGYDVSGGLIFAPNNPISLRAPHMIRVNALSWLILAIISIPFITKRKMDMVELDESEHTEDLISSIYDEENEDYEDHLTAPDTADITEEKVENKKFFSALLSLASLQVFLMMLLTAFYPYFLAINFKSFGMEKIENDIFMTTVGAIGAVVNGVSRIGWATLFDYFGFKYVFILLLVMQTANAFTIIFIRAIPILYLIWVAVSFICFGGIVTLFPPLAAKIFGPKTGSRVYSILFFSIAIAAIGSFFLTIMSTRGSISLEVLFYIFGGLSAASLLITLTFKEVRVGMITNPKEVEEEERRFSVHDYVHTG